VANKSSFNIAQSMLNKEEYFKIARERTQAPKKDLKKNLKIILAIYAIFLVVNFIAFYFATRYSKTPDNRSTPILELVLYVFLFTTFLTLIGFVVVGKPDLIRLLKLSRYKRDYRRLKYLLDTGKKFIFYLREFKTGRSVSSYWATLPGGNSGYHDVYGSTHMGDLTRKISKYLPIVLLETSFFHI
jgi:hypothetical protein